MSKDQLPKHYIHIRKDFPEMAQALNDLGKAVRNSGPIDDKTAHLIQLAGAVGVQSEGAVKSHVRQALEGGAHKDEIVHALLLLTSTVGFPTMSAAMSWAEDEFSD